MSTILYLSLNVNVNDPSFSGTAACKAGQNRGFFRKEPGGRRSKVEGRRWSGIASVLGFFERSRNFEPSTQPIFPPLRSNF